MLMGHTEGLPKFGSSKKLLLSGPTSEADGDEHEQEVIPEEILYMASFEELASKYVLYDTIIWVSISLLLVLAWGIGVFMLLYLPIRRYVLQKDISSRKLYVTPDTIVYKVSRPSFIPFWGVTNFEKHVPLSLVIDIIIEQGCLQSVYGIHTFRVESIASGKAAPVDELQVQGVSNPGYLRKVDGFVILREASKIIHDVGRSWKTTVHGIEGESTARMDFLTEAPAGSRSPSKLWKMVGSSEHASVDYRGARSDLLMNKIEEVSKSVKRIEVLVEKSQATTGSIQ